MSDSIINRIKQQVLTNSKTRFWFWQAGFWLFVSVVSFVTLTLWYSVFTWANLSHTLLQGVLGLAFSLVMYEVFMRIWDQQVRVRVLLGLFIVFSVALIWTVFRMYALAWLTDFDSFSEEFGGWYFASIFIFLCWTGLFHGIRYYELLQREHEIMLQAEAETRSEHIKRLEAQSVARDSQLKMLRYQLNPHFLCNTLNAINSLIELDEAEKAQQMTVHLSEFLRHSLDNNPDTKVTLKEEIAALNLYLEIEKTRFGERLNIEYDIDEDSRIALVPSLLLQPIIENSMKYAIAKSENGGSISICAFIKNNNLCVILGDTGADERTEFDAQENKKKRGVGLSNMNQRLSTLYGKRFSVVSENVPTGGLSTTINIPYECKQSMEQVVNS
jgi:sensor histidine kinase YesM